MAEPSPPEDRPLDPEKLLRIASLARAILEEVRQMEPDDHTTGELVALHGRVMDQLEHALPSELYKELEQIDLELPFRDSASPPEVRVAYSGLIGWLGGLFQGLQAAMQMQQSRALQSAQERAQLEGPPTTPGQYL
ncbi:MAG: proteasome activator [Actinomycetota bacterium]